MISNILKTVILTVLTQSSASVNAQSDIYAMVVAGFYNVENLFDTLHDANKSDYEYLPQSAKKYNTSSYHSKIDNLSTALTSAQFASNSLDLLGLAEVENNNVLIDLKQSLQNKTGKSYEFVHYESSDFRGIDVAFIYNSKIFKVDTSFPITVTLPVGAHGGHDKTRDILAIKGKLAKEEFYFFINHWPSRYGGKTVSNKDRMIAAMTLRRNIDSIFALNSNANIIVMGDFNDNPDDETIQKIVRTAQQKNMKMDQLYNPFFEPYKKGIGSLAWQDKWALFDQIFVSKNIIDNKQQFYLYKSGILNNPELLETQGKYKGYPKRSYNYDTFVNGFSDHLPVFIQLIKKL